MLKFLLWLKRINFNKLFVPRYNDKYKNKQLKLNLGCGTDYKFGWINVDNNSYHNITKLDINFDLSKGIPFKDSTVDFIYNEHFLEHLTVDEGQIFLKECKRCLKEGGVLRIAMPDLTRSMEEYFNPNWREDNIERFKKFGLQDIQTRAERINIAFRSWGHKWLYDKEELERRLKEAGFKKVEFCEYKKSSYPELQNLETRQESTLIAEVVK